MNRALNHLNNRREWVVLALILALSLALRLLFLHEPFERDEGQYATIAQEILRGGMPYRDGIEIKPPGIFYLYAAAIGLFGPTVAGIRLFTAFYSVLTGILVYAVARRVASPAAALSSVAIFGIFSSFPPQLQGTGSNSEVFLILPLLGSAWCILGALETGKRRYLAGAGLCAGISVLIKQVAVPFIALELLVIPFIRWEKGGWKRVAGDAGAFLVPMAACGVATLGYFAARGGLHQLLYWTLIFPRKYRGSEVGGPALIDVAKQLAPLVIPVILAAASLPWFSRARRDARGLFTVLLVPAAFVAVALPGKYFLHYFIVPLPFLAILAGIGLTHLAATRAAASYLIGFVIVVVSGASLPMYFPYYTSYSSEEVSVAKHGTPLFVQAAETAAYLKERTAPSDYIFQWGMEPELYFLADRRSPSPHLVNITVGWSGDPEKEIRRLLFDLRSKRPRYIVIQDIWYDLPGFQKVQDLVDAEYVFDRDLPFGAIFRLKGIPPTPGR